MFKKILLIGFVLMVAVNIVLIRANMRLGYNIEAKIKQPPKIHVFQTQYKGGTQVVFNHQEHVEDFGLECIECHHVEVRVVESGISFHHPVQHSGNLLSRKFHELYL